MVAWQNQFTGALPLPSSYDWYPSVWKQYPPQIADLLFAATQTGERGVVSGKWGSTSVPKVHVKMLSSKWAAKLITSVRQSGLQPDKPTKFQPPNQHKTGLTTWVPNLSSTPNGPSKQRLAGQPKRLETQNTKKKPSYNKAHTNKTNRSMSCCASYQNCSAKLPRCKHEIQHLGSISAFSIFNNFLSAVILVPHSPTKLHIQGF